MDPGSPDNLVPLRQTDISPAVLLQEIGKNIDLVDQMFIVAFDDEGVPSVFMSGDIKNMVYAAFVMQHLAADIAREGGDI